MLSAVWRAPVYFLHCFLFLFPVALTAQDHPAINTSVQIQSTDDFREQFGKNKKIPSVYEKEILKALSYFPELKNNRIDFVLRYGYAPLSARPSFGGLFRRASKRKYKVFISTGRKDGWDKFTLKNTPYEARVGIIGHELSHVKNFAKMSGLQLFGLGVAHVSRNYMNRFEYLTDSLTIEQGLGEYLLASSIFARKIFNAPDPEQLNVAGVKGNYNERYMSPATIRRYLADSRYPYTQAASSQ